MGWSRPNRERASRRNRLPAVGERAIGDFVGADLHEVVVPLEWLAVAPQRAQQFGAREALERLGVERRPQGNLVPDLPANLVEFRQRTGGIAPVLGNLRPNAVALPTTLDTRDRRAE